MAKILLVEDNETLRNILRGGLFARATRSFPHVAAGRGLRRRLANGPISF